MSVLAKSTFKMYIIQTVCELSTPRRGDCVIWSPGQKDNSLTINWGMMDRIHKRRDQGGNLLFILQTQIKVKLFAFFARGSQVNIFSMLTDIEIIKGAVWNDWQASFYPHIHRLTIDMVFLCLSVINVSCVWWIFAEPLKYPACLILKQFCDCSVWNWNIEFKVSSFKLFFTLFPFHSS